MLPELFLFGERHLRFGEFQQLGTVLRVDGILRDTQALVLVVHIETCHALVVQRF